MRNSNSKGNGPSMGWCRNAIQLLAIPMGVLLLCTSAFAQGSAGRILGTVTDQSGGTVAGATVTVVDTARGISRTLTTDDAGEYNAPNLTPGTYVVRAEAKGFKKLERQNISLEVGKEVRIDLTVQPGEQEQTVTVTEAIPLVETTNATLGGTINNAEIIDMPLNGRNYQNLVSLRPGVMVQPGGGPWTQSTNGIRPDETVWMVDGVINTNMYDARPILNMPSPFSDGATILPVDAIQEFNTEITPKSEYGWKPGAVVNVGLKSGSNSFHGSTYGFYRSAAWDARNLFDPTIASGPSSCANALTAGACALTPVQLKQFGGVIGGPIKKDRLFFFAGYEGLRSLIGNAIVTGGIPETVSTGSPQNSMVDAIMALQKAGVPVSPLSLTLAGCPSGILTTASVCTPPNYSWPTNPTNGTNFIATFPNVNVTDNGVAKIDYHINDKNSLNGMLFIGNYTGNGMDHPFVNALFRDTNLDRTYTIGSDWVYVINSRLVNDVRFGYDRVWFVFNTDDGTKFADGTSAGYPINTGAQFPGLPNINLSGFEKLGSWHNRPQNWANNYYDIQDNLSYLVGKHALKFGGEFARIDVTNAIPDTGRGLIAFKGNKSTGLGITDCKGGTKSCPLEDFFAGLPSGGNLLSGSANREEKWNSIAAFAQDDWRLNSRLIFNLGVRYSYVTPIHEINGLWGNFDPTKGLIQQPSDGSLYKRDPYDLSPRAGFAWDLDGKGTTVVRGGFSINYSFITAVTFLNQNGFTAPGATSVALPAVPTGAVLQTGNCLATTAGCPTAGGSINLQSASFKASQLNWNGKVFGAPTAVCGDGLSYTVAPGTAGLNAGSYSDASPCNIMAVDPNLTTPYIMSYSLGVQHSFGNNLSLDVGYVGNRGSRLTGFRDINQIPASPTNATVTAANPSGRPFGIQFPYLQWIIQASNDGHSNYNSVQASLTKRISHGVSFIAGYTYGHGLDTGTLNRTGYLPQNSQNVAGEYGNSDFDIRHRFTFTVTYDVPGIKGFGQLLEGWKLNSIVTVQSAQPWQTYDSNNSFCEGNGSTSVADFTCRWNITGPSDAFTSGPNGIPYCTGPGANGCGITSGINGKTTFFSAAQSTAMWAQCTNAADPASVADGNLAANGCYVSGNSVITPPANGTYGNMGRNILRDSGFKDVDFSIFKIFTFKERYSAQFRFEVFNLFNHPISANPYGGANGYGVGNDPSVGANGGGLFGCGCATADVAAGSPQIGSGGARGMQLGLKLAF